MKKTILLLAIVSFSVMAGGNENTINANAMIEIKKIASSTLIYVKQ